MTAQQVLDLALARGVVLYVDGDQLKYRAKAGALSADLKNGLTSHRQQIVEQLKRLNVAAADVPLPAAIGKLPRGARVPLSYAQQRMWILDRLGEHDTSYHVQSVHRLTGPLNVDALRRAFATILERHESLRTVVGEDEGAPYQIVQAAHEDCFTQIDLRGRTPEAQQQEVDRHVWAESRRRIDLSRDLMIRVVLLTLASDRHTLILRLHHIATDEWSQRLLRRELAVLYAEYCSGGTNPLPPLPLQYGDYSAWQRAWLDEEGVARHVAFWRAELKDAPEVHRLPLDRERPRTPTHKGAAHALVVDAATLARVRSACRDRDVTLFMFLHAVTAILLARSSGETDIVLGTPVAGRVHPDFEPLIGLFVNTIALRTTLDAQETFEHLLTRSKTHLIEVLAHQHLPFDMVVEALRPKRRPNYGPIYQILFSVAQAESGLLLPGVEVEAAPRGAGASKVDLTVHAIESPETLRVFFGYDTDLFEAETIAQMASAFASLLQHVVAEPTARIGELRVPGVEARLRARSAGDTADHHVVPIDAEEESEPQPPATDTERRLAAVWSKVLRRETDDVNENFFTAGGHSLSMIVLIQRIAKEMGVDVPLTSFIESPTIRAVAAFVDVTLAEKSVDEQPSRHATQFLAALTSTDRERPLPLSSAQARIWFMSRTDSTGAAYNVPFPMRLSGPLDVAALRRAFEAIVSRHAILRTVYREENNEPVQLIQPPAPFPLPILDLRTLSTEAQRQSVDQHVRADAIAPFDLTREPSIRAALIQLSDVDHVLMLNLHHIATDGASTRILVRELNLFYDAFTRGTTPAVSELPIQYGDYAAWQRRELESGRFAEDLRFWKERLEGIPAVHGLPLDSPRPLVPTYRGAYLTRTVDAGTRAALEALSRSRGGTLQMTMHAAFAALMHRYSTEDDIVIGTPVANRVEPEVEPLIGCFVNTLVLRSQLHDNPRFTDFLSQNVDDWLQALARQRAPFERLVEELNPARALNYSPLAQVMFGYQHGDAGSVPSPSPLNFSSLADENTLPVSKFDLGLFARESGGRLTLVWGYASDLFRPETIQAMATAFEELLQNVAESPETHVDALRLVSGDTEKELSRLGCGVPAPDDIEQTVPELFTAAARQQPTAIAVRCGSQSLTYAELNDRASEVAARLSAHQIADDAMVAIFMERSLELVVALLGVLKAGAAYVPLDVAYPADRLRHMMANSGSTVVLTTSALSPSLPVTPATVLRIDDPSDGAAARQTSGSTIDSSDRTLTRNPDAVAYVMYTSGSTGQPKGVAVPHRAITRLVRKTDYVPLGPDTVTLLHSPVSFDAATFEVWAPLLNGGTVVLQQSDNRDVARLAEEVSTHGVNTLFLTTALLPLWVQHHPVPSSLRYLMVGGEVVQPSYVNALYRRDPDVNILNVYGPTENTTFSTYYPVPRERQDGPLPIGRPIRGSTAYVVGQTMTPQPIGCPGELCVGGSGVALGYWGDATLTSERFVRDPFSTSNGDRLYKTGDVARWRFDGALEFLGRKDHQVKLRGFRVELAEIEVQLAQVPGVAQATVIVADISGTGRELVAYVVPVVSESGRVDEECSALLRERCRDRLKQTLPEYMVPSLYVVLERMPLTPSGKVNRHALPIPDPAARRSAGHAPPTTPTQQALCQMWAELLNAPEVGIDDDFFDLGGHSLLAFQFNSAAAARFGVDIPMQALFERSTIREFAKWIDVYKSTGASGDETGDGEELIL